MTVAVREALLIYLDHNLLTGGTHNVLYVATEKRQRVAFDADKKSAPLGRYLCCSPTKRPSQVAPSSVQGVHLHAGHL